MGLRASRNRLTGELSRERVSARMAWRGIGLLALAALTLAACDGGPPGSNAAQVTTATTTPTSPAAPTPTPTTAPATPSSAAPAPAGSARNTVSAVSQGINAAFTEAACADTSLLTVVPSGGTILYANCGGYYRFVGSDTGPLAPLRAAPAGTAVAWTDGAGTHYSKTLDGTVNTVPRDAASGQFPGHGVPPGGTPAFFQLRNSTRQVEIEAT